MITPAKAGVDNRRASVCFMLVVVVFLVQLISLFHF